MLESAGKKSDHGQKLRPTRPSHHEDGLEIQGHPCDGDPWIALGTEGGSLGGAVSVGLIKGTFKGMTADHIATHTHTNHRDNGRGSYP